MRTSKWIRGAVLAVMAFTTQLQAQEAETRFLQLSLTPKIALHKPDMRIKGVSLNIWGRNPQSALALGFVNGSSGDSLGLSWGLCNYSENYKGVQLGFVNYSKGQYIGWMDGMVNIANEFKGLQSGFLNIGQSVKGVQFGTVNYTRQLNGVQIGFANIVTENPWFTEFPEKLAMAFPFVNWSF